MIRFLIVPGKGEGAFLVANKIRVPEPVPVLYKEQYSDGEEGDPDDEIEREEPLDFWS